MTYDPNYKLRFKPTSARRLERYKYPPGPFIGDPPSGDWNNYRNAWERRARALYGDVMARKRGTTAEKERRGLWFYLC